MFSEGYAGSLLIQQTLNLDITLQQRIIDLADDRSGGLLRVRLAHPIQWQKLKRACKQAPFKYDPKGGDQ